MADSIGVPGHRRDPAGQGGEAGGSDLSLQGKEGGGGGGGVVS